MPTYDELIYRGNYSLSAGVNYDGSILSADKGGGLRDDERIFPGLLEAQLNYSALHKRAKVQLPNGEAVDRLSYVWWFYRKSKDGGNAPFLMRSPLDEKLYLWIFPENRLTIQLVDRYLGTAGLAVAQVSVSGVTTLADGSIDEGVTLP